MINFIINQRLPSLNDYIGKCRQNKYLANNFKNDIDDICRYSMLRNKSELREYCKEPVIIWIIWHERTKRRDLDNIFSASKYILDAMQKINVLVNDNYKYVKGIYNSICYSRQDFVEVQIFRLDEAAEMMKAYCQYEVLRLQNERSKK